jgi:hypothetical protein
MNERVSRTCSPWRGVQVLSKPFDLCGNVLTQHVEPAKKSKFLFRNDGHFLLSKCTTEEEGLV